MRRATIARHRAERGITLVEVLVGTALGLAVVASLASAVASGGRLLALGSARAEAEDTVQLALEALAFDVRRAGWDPAGAGIVGLTQADADGFGVVADLDGDGTVDATSEEVVRWRCDNAGRRLVRTIGQQAMSLAEGVVGCTLDYVAAGGVPLVPPLDAARRAKVAAIGLRVRLAPGVHAASERTARFALRAAP
jgi:Tfp pilus assembly protein PilW